MLAEVNMSSGYITDMIGVLLCLYVAVSSRWRFKEKNKENNVLLLLLACVFISCIANSVAIWADGKPGQFARNLVYISNTWSFMACIFNGYLWISFMEEHIHGANSVIPLRIIQTISMVGLLILIVNFYIPIIFSVNGSNVYERRPLFELHMLIQVCFLIYAIIMYLIAKFVRGGLSVFPVWIYIVPLLLGSLAQYLVYGTSFIWPSAAFATACMFDRFNKQDKYRDSVTYLYRYDYIKILNENLKRYKNRIYRIIFIQVIGLVGVQSRYGIQAEDEARIDIANILKKNVMPKGIIAQCEGDAFIIVLNTNDSQVSERCIEQLQNEFDEYNRINKKDYSLSFDFKQELVNVDEATIDEVVNRIRKE